MNNDITNTQQQPKRIELWKRRLLDFSLRNPFINVRIGQKAIEIFSPKPSEIEDFLFNGDDFYIQHNDNNNVNTSIEKNTLYTSLDEKSLTAFLKKTYRTAKVAIEENGANALFISTGIVRWMENGNSRYAPLLLIPVELVRKPGNKYVLHRRDEPTTINTTLFEMIRRQFSIDLIDYSELPTDNNGIDVETVFETIRAAIKPLDGWEVEERTLLSVYSFNKFPIWKDINLHADKLLQHPIISSLVNRQNNCQPTSIPIDIRDYDKTTSPDNTAIPMDVDSSQLEAVLAATQGESFILHGPPGTGKSQTISNIIANALYQGKRVLFVSEKMAALEVVQKRLRKIGIAPFCLELHSNKTTRIHLLNQLHEALEAKRISEPQEYKKMSEEIMALRSEIGTYADILHTKLPQGLSLYDTFTRIESIQSDELYPVNIPEELPTEQTINKWIEMLEDLDTTFKLIQHPSIHPLNGIHITNSSIDLSVQLAERLNEIAGIFEEATQHINQLKVAYGIRKIYSLAQLRDVSASLEQWMIFLKDYHKAQELKSNITNKYGSQSLNLNIEDIKTKWNKIQQEWFLNRIITTKQFVSDFKKQGCHVKSHQIADMISNLSTYHNLNNHINTTVGNLSKNLELSIDNLISNEIDINDIENIHLHIHKFLEAITEAQPIVTFDEDKEYKENGFTSSFKEAINNWIRHSDKAREWMQWCVRKDEIEKEGLSYVIKYILNNNKSGSESAAAMSKGWYTLMAKNAVANHRQLQMFDAVIFDDLLKKYRSKVRLLQQLTCKMLYYKIADRLPSASIDAAASSELGKLKHYIGNKGRGMTIRNILDNIPTLIRKLCPCMLMSPLSVSQYLEMSPDLFDIVIFDEASQMPTCESVGAISRGKSLVVVGDPMQMPPTSFFATTQTDEEDVEDDDLESILDDCLAISLPSRYLTWHYRSRHESLIDFSNHHFYESRLFTFPSADDRASKVSFRHIDGVYDMGKTRTNRIEAQAVVAEVITRLQNQDHQKQSIGIVAFSKAQQELIEDIFQETVIKYPDLENIAFNSEEPIFIKNLENVQGDERDVILFSIGYGPDENGKVLINFGPLNNKGGERRLNVAASRARCEMIVFSSMTADQIDLNRTQSEGVRCLKDFLLFASQAETKASRMNNIGTAHNDSYQYLLQSLEQAGYTYDTNIGRSNFKIDIAVIDPQSRNKNNYLLGILTDGISYYAANTVRDREICRIGVLQGLNWNIARLWSVDWWIDSEKVTKRILSQLKQLEEGIHDSEEDNLHTDKFNILEEQEVTVPIQHAVEYKVANIGNVTSTYTIDKIANSGEEVSTILAKIIHEEQPVTFSYLCRRTAAYFKVRETANLRILINKFMPDVYLDTDIDASNPSYWDTRMSAANYKYYRERGGRSIDEIPPIEISNAILLLMKNQLTAQKDELVKQITRILGATRTTPKMTAIITQVIEHLITTNKLRQEENVITICNQQ